MSFSYKGRHGAGAVKRKEKGLRMKLGKAPRKALLHLFAIKKSTEEAEDYFLDKPASQELLKGPS